MNGMSRLAPDLILHHGRIYTLAGEPSVVEAVAVKEGRILTVGGNAPLLALADAQTRLIDLQGRTVIPGIFDSHNHLLQVGVKLTRIRLDECRSAAEMMDPKENSRRFEWDTRTYRVRLLAPAWVGQWLRDEKLRGGAAAKMRLRVTLTSGAEGGNRRVLQDVFVMEP